VSFFVAYAFRDQDDIVDGNEIGSATGWLTFADWTADLPEEEYPKLVNLAEYGECGPDAADIDKLETELARALGEKPGNPDENMQGVGRHLLAELRSRPIGADCLVVTDGTGSGEEQ
jgi:hypothetical protein